MLAGGRIPELPYQGVLACDGIMAGLDVAPQGTERHSGTTIGSISRTTRRKGHSCNTLYAR